MSKKYCDNKSQLPQEKEPLQREIEPAADVRIDRLVYEMYGLSEEEIRVVDCGYVSCCP